jgi:site-specific DNA-methyltransferase (adenine-specific)
MINILEGDNLTLLKAVPTSTVRLCYTDPPYNTGVTQRLGEHSYADLFSDLPEYLRPRLFQVWRTLTNDGSLFVHLDYREVHRVKVMLDSLVGRSHFINEIIWAYDYGARSKVKWPCKHDNILWYAKDPDRYIFNYAEVDRIPYMAPELVGPEKAALGKTPTDVWWHTIVPTAGKERTGYPTQKPRGIVDRIVKVHSCRGDLLLDPFAGSGTLGASAQALGRDCILMDSNPAAIKVITERLS